MPVDPDRLGRKAPFGEPAQDLRQGIETVLANDQEIGPGPPDDPTGERHQRGVILRALAPACLPIALFGPLLALCLSSQFFRVMLLDVQLHAHDPLCLALVRLAACVVAA